MVVGRAVLLLWAVAAAHLACAQGGDLQAQILYAYYSEDANQLASVTQTLNEQIKSGDADASLRYHLAHAQYRLGLLTAEKHKRQSAESFSDCIDQLKDAPPQVAAEALVLRSACSANLARHRMLEAILLRSRAADMLNAALKLAPRNPRAVYLAAMEELSRSKFGSAANQNAFVKLQFSAQLFEQSSATRLDTPGWGHAEAYLALGRQMQLRGDALGARNWIEKALIAAPAFKAAQRQLATLLRR